VIFSNLKAFLNVLFVMKILSRESLEERILLSVLYVGIGDLTERDELK
jgi:hypothetical protein